MKKIRKIIFSLIVALLLVGSILPRQDTVLPVNAAVSKKQTAKFVKAVDGDTAKLKVKGKTYTFRFLAVDTPETVKPNTKVAYMGKKASNYTKQELKKAKKIQIQYDGAKKDKYGRRLAWIWVDGKLLQNKLVKKGYARVYYIYGKYKYTGTLKTSEKVAKNKKIGIWKNYSAAFPNYPSSDKTQNNVKKINSSKPSISSYVWIPRTGSKYHSNPSCSGMNGATRVSQKDAISRGFSPCKKCYN